MKLSISLLLFVLLSVATCAQQFGVGVLGGTAITTVNGIKLDENNCSLKFGVTAGGSVYTRITPKSVLQMEIAYTQKGSLQSPDSTNNNDYYTLKLNYIDITVLWKRQLHLGINKNPIDKFGFEAGITLGSLVYSSYTVKSQAQPTTEFNKFDGSLLVGLYYNFTPNFYLSGSYSNSFIPVIKHNGQVGIDYPYYSSWNRGNNLVIQFTFGFIFGGSSLTEKKVMDSSPE